MKEREKEKSNMFFYMYISVNGYAMVKTVHNSVYDGNCDISAAMSWTEVQFRRDLLLQK